MKVICISGHAGAGKDTFANFLKEELERRGESVVITHFGDAVKHVCRSFFGWDGRKDVDGRTLLQYVGTDAVRYYYPDFWAEFIAQLAHVFHHKWDYMLIPDCRFPNEFEIFTQYDIPAKLIRIERGKYAGAAEKKSLPRRLWDWLHTQPEEVRADLTAAQKNHASETSMDDYPVDCTVDNCCGLTELYCAAAEMAQDIVDGRFFEVVK